MSTGGGLGLAIVMAAAVPGALTGQVPPVASPDPAVAELVLDREVFVYPGTRRRDPFRPLLAGDPATPRFEELRLLGVILSPDPRQSIALVGVDAARPLPSAGTGRRTFRVRPETVLGDMKILRVERSRVIVEIEHFGVKEQRELALDRQRGRSER